MDQTPLVPLRIEEDLEGPGSVAVDTAHPSGTKGLCLSASVSDVWHADVEVEPILHGLALWDLLESKAGPSRRIHIVPELIPRIRRPTQHRRPELGQDLGVRAVDDDLVNPSDHVGDASRYRAGGDRNRYR